MQIAMYLWAGGMKTKHDVKKLYDCGLIVHIHPSNSKATYSLFFSPELCT